MSVPSRPSPGVSPVRALLLSILIAALLCAHWQGLAHRIGHASRMLGGTEQVKAQAAISADAASGSLEQAGHSCLAFDAATVGAFLASTPFVVDPARCPAVSAVWLAFISYLAPCTTHFSSRAPPRL
jgi:hypothetical protein